MIKRRIIWAVLGTVAVVGMAWSSIDHRAVAQSNGELQIVALSPVGGNSLFAVTDHGSWRVYQIANDAGGRLHIRGVTGESEDQSASKSESPLPLNDVVPSSTPIPESNPYWKASPDVAGAGDSVRSKGDDLEIEILRGNPASVYLNELRLVSPGPERTIATNEQVGKVVHLGRFSPGVELLFEDVVQNTHQTYKSGPATRNLDRMSHAVVRPQPNGEWIIGFEDVAKHGDPTFQQPDYTYDDLLFCLRPVRGASTPSSGGIP